MLFFYFSGTGNSAYIARLFRGRMGATCHSIEESADFTKQIAAEDVIGFCYPVYGSRVPRIMREFALKQQDALRGKRVILFCTQLIFSGDGARAFCDLFPPDFFQVIYAEHFLMPNNICNFALLPLAAEGKIKKYVTRAERKMEAVCRDIKAGRVRKRGFHPLSRALGLIQGAFLPKIEEKARGAVRIQDSCTCCGLCVSLCPVGNLACENGKIAQRHRCALCYRCINKCPEKAITVFLRRKVKKQYKGL